MLLNKRPVVWLDTETTGLDENKHEIIEICLYCETDPERCLTVKVQPEHIERADRIALQVNGYAPWKWKHAVAWSKVGPDVNEMLKDAIVAGQNVDFDMRHINASLKRLGINADHGRHKIELSTLSYEYLVPMGLEGLELHAVCDFLGIPNEGAHGAKADVMRSLQAYKTIKMLVEEGQSSETPKCGGSCKCAK